MMQLASDNYDDFTYDEQRFSGETYDEAYDGYDNDGGYYNEKSYNNNNSKNNKSSSSTSSSRINSSYGGVQADDRYPVLIAMGFPEALVELVVGNAPANQSVDFLVAKLSDMIDSNTSGNAAYEVFFFTSLFTNGR